ncbi:MAG: site-specific DNA-methyltransferase [Planctomycetes bacterium]|nr:site-specific DNA-methyltransferase [Planctomycetota bacterium]
MSEKLDKLKGLLAELFQLDQADLDFGIYRIMNQKRDEIIRFLDRDLLPQVQEAFKQYKSADKAVLQTELDKLVASVQGAGMNPDDSPRVKELRQRIADSAVNVSALENEVFSHLFSFFRRYYSEGDFLSLRRYKEGVYAIPYEGEEVKLHWANADQYYVKSSEAFKDYTFRIESGKRVRVHLVAATTEHGTNRPPAGKERRFVLAAKEPLKEESGELFIRFEYRLTDGKDKQEDLNKAAIEAILKTPGFDRWTHDLNRFVPKNKKDDPDCTVIEKHLSQYTKKNTFDYFIHKDLGGFLRRELDFFIKNEVMHLDDIEHETSARVEQYLSQIKVIRRIASQIIRFLEQLETFQKRLWLKKKFVIESNYCITLDLVPKELYPAVAANVAQREEWVRLFAIDAIKGDLASAGYTVPLTVSFLNEHPTLVIDTKFFPRAFVDQLCASIGDLASSMNGLLVHGDNFHALALIHPSFAEKVRCIYIDPPYNTDSSAILYKNNYRHSTWGTLMRDRLALMKLFLPSNGAIFVSIDKAERTILEHMMDNVFGRDHRVEELIWSMNTNNSQAPNYSTNHEYVEVYAKNRAVAEQDRQMFREPKPGYDEVVSLVSRLNPSFPSVAAIEAELRALYKQHRAEYKQDIEGKGLEWEDEKGNDSWKGLYNYDRAEYRDKAGCLVSEEDASTKNASIWVWRESDASMPAAKQAASTGDPEDPNWRFYRPAHPTTKRPCPHPKSGWKFAYADDEDSPGRRSFVSLDRDHRIAWGPDETKVPQLKRFLHEVETNVGKSVFVDYSDGEKQTSAMFGRSGVFLAPKHSAFVSRFIVHSATATSVVLDCFGGSGSTAHAVVDLNRSDHGTRKYVLVESGHHFDDVMKPRICKAVYSSTWKGGKPLDRLGKTSHCIKYIRLESYEDSLNNLCLRRTDKQSLLIEEDAGMREQYSLSYMLDVESRGSQSLLNVEAFHNPDEYKLRVERNGEFQLVNVDLVETFNWLLGLTVKHIDVIRGVRVVEGKDPDGHRVLVLWRNIDKVDNDALDKWFEKQAYNTREMEYDLFYVNGDNNLENLRRPDQTWKVRLIEEEFKRLMFDVQDV